MGAPGILPLTREPPTFSSSGEASTAVARLPEHLRTKRGRDRLARLRRYANAVRGLYGVPVYLCGSALLDVNENPRDWDIRITLPDDDFRRRFGDPKQWAQESATGRWSEVRWRWSDRCVKDSKDGYMRTVLNIDFQAYPASHARAFKHLPRLRLDTRRG